VLFEDVEERLAVPMLADDVRERLLISTAGLEIPSGVEE
jgi:hypothetical protein